MDKDEWKPLERDSTARAAFLHYWRLANESRINSRLPHMELNSRMGIPTMLSYNLPDRVRLVFDVPRGGLLLKRRPAVVTRNIVETIGAPDQARFGALLCQETRSGRQ